MRSRITRLGIVIAGEALVIGALFVVALDIRAHTRVEELGGVNIWGYRGDVASAKRADETRVLALGGSTTFGYGLPWDQSWPYYLNERIGVDRRTRGYKTPVSVVNLGIPADTARTFGDEAGYCPGPPELPAATMQQTPLASASCSFCSTTSDGCGLPSDMLTMSIWLAMQ